MIVKGAKINDRYQIVRTLGEGGMANVYLAYDIILNRNVAVKVLRGDLASDEKFVRRFQREALSASSLSHQNIVEIYDVGEDDGQYYIVMEYVPGKTLKQLLKKRGNLTVTEVVDIMLQLSDAMGHAHSSYIIHRDIKPQNVMILENGLIKITDFGIAMALNSTQLTQTNSVMGSVHYLPPEQANGQGSTIRSDIYSMGILMYELLTGHVPYRGENAVEIALKHLKDPLPSIKNELPNLPQSLENVILKSTAKNPKNRYKDANEMYNDLKTALDDSRRNEDKYVYPYPESDVDETKAIPKKEIKKAIDDFANEEDEGNNKKSNDSKQNKLLIVLLSIFAGLAVITATLVLVLPLVLKKPEVEVPNVRGLTETQAEAKLIKKGFKVADESKKEASSKYKKGKVTRTNPAIGKKIKKGATITLYISTGKDSFKLKDYTGENVYEVKAVLKKVNGLDVVIEQKETTANYEKNIIIEQDPKPGTKMNKGDTITLYIKKEEIKYPDFTKNDYTIDDVKAFCKENEVTLDIKTVETTEYNEGAIIKQSRPAGSVVLKGYPLVISVAASPVSSEAEE